MEINEIMEQLSIFGHDKPLPREALAEAARQREAITPVLLDRLDWLLENVRGMEDEVYNEPEYDQSLYAIFLLAQFREKLAYPKLLRLMSLDRDQLDIALGDQVCEMSDILYSTYDGDLASTKALAADASLDPFARNQALDLMLGLLRDGRMSREELVSFIRERLESLEDGEDEEFFAALLAETVAEADLFELMEDIRDVYSQEKVDLTFLGDFDDFLDSLFSETRSNHQARYVEDAAVELASWACFKKDKPSKPSVYDIKTWKAGRNDPCPCGSGKKFKKCCLKTLEEWELRSERYADLERDPYPSVTGHGGRPGLADYFSQDAITVDRPVYMALRLLEGPAFRSREEEHRAKRQARTLLLEAFQKMRRICSEQGFDTPEEFDYEYHVHYDCVQWLEVLIELLDKEDPNCSEAEAFLYG